MFKTKLLHDYPKDRAMTNEKKTKEILYYPRRMRVEWCVAHEVTAAGVTIERYGIKCRTYAEAYKRADKMNREQLPVPNSGNPSDIELTKGGGRL